SCNIQLCNRGVENSCYIVGLVLDLERDCHEFVIADGDSLLSLDLAGTYNSDGELTLSADFSSDLLPDHLVGSETVVTNIVERIEGTGLAPQLLYRPVFEFLFEAREEGEGFAVIPSNHRL